MRTLFISPHNDDEALFGAYTLMREHPLVVIVTDSYIQFERGDGITAEQRRNETKAALKILWCPVIFAGIRDTELNESNLRNLFTSFYGFNKIYAPAIQGGNMQHDLVGKIAKDVFENVSQYATYTKTEPHTRGDIEIAPAIEEIHLKNMALDCYVSQIELPSTAPYFYEARNKSEWLIQ